MKQMELSRELGATLTASLAVGVVAGSAGASIVTVMDPGQTNITSGQATALSVFSPSLTLTPLDPYYGTNLAPNSVNMAFSAGYYGTFGFIRGNLLPANAPVPLDTPALMRSGGQSLAVGGSTVDIGANFDIPFMQSGYYGNTLHVAQLATSQGDFNMFAYTDGDFGYIGYAASDLSNFGYIQMQRQNLTSWSLIGYRYGTAGEPITIQDLTVPAPAALAPLAVAGLFSGRRKRRAS